MRIIVNHLTRMAPGYICVAGINPVTGQHVRPTTYGRLSRRLLRAMGGPFDIAVIVDIGDAVPEGVAPEMEDHRFEPSRARYCETTAPATFWTLLETVARPALADIFGTDLRQSGSSCSVARGVGLASLGCLKPATRPRLVRDMYGKLRMHISDGTVTASVPVTDIRLVKDDHVTIRDDVETDLTRRIERGVPVILSVGLSRPFAKSAGEEERHWLQVNGIHLEDNPVWQVEASQAHTVIEMEDIPF